MALKPFRPVRVNIGGTRAGSEAAKQFSKIEDNFRQWTLHLSGQSGEVLRMALMPTLALAKKYCPKKTGELRDSGYVEVRRKGAFQGYEAEIGFGRGGKPTYALYVHEVPYKHVSPTSWKYLQRAVTEDSGNIQRRLIDGFKTAGGV
jgi:hypothetical protein